MRRFLFVLVVGCGAAPLAPAPVQVPRAAPATTTEIVTETRARPAPAARNPIVRRGLLQLEMQGEEVVLPTERRHLFDRPINYAETDFLSRCVREFVQTRSESARRPLIAALAQYATSCDADGRVVLERPLGYDSRDRRARSDAMFTGTLSAQRVDIVLRVAACSGGDSASPDHIAIVADDQTWTSQRLEFARDGNACDVAEMPYTRALGRALFRASESEDAVIRFEGSSVELPITDVMKHELRVVLDAVDALAP